MKQTRTASLVEIVSSVGVGFVISYFIYLWGLPALGFAITSGQALGVTVIFTVVSIARSYVLRRVFEHLRHVGIMP